VSILTTPDPPVDSIVEGLAASVTPHRCELGARGASRLVEPEPQPVAHTPKKAEIKIVTERLVIACTARTQAPCQLKRAADVSDATSGRTAMRPSVANPYHPRSRR
jgi:hypothetical protein